MSDWIGVNLSSVFVDKLLALNIHIEVLFEPWL